MPKVFRLRRLDSSCGSWYTVCHGPINKMVVGSPSTCACITFHYSTNNILGKMVQGHVVCVHDVKACKEGRGTAVFILNVSSRWR
jgi:hypothetical protein